MPLDHGGSPFDALLFFYLVFAQPVDPLSRYNEQKTGDSKDKNYGHHCKRQAVIIVSHNFVFSIKVVRIVLPVKYFCLPGKRRGGIDAHRCVPGRKITERVKFVLYICEKDLTYG